MFRFIPLNSRVSPEHPAHISFFLNKLCLKNSSDRVEKITNSENESPKSDYVEGKRVSPKSSVATQFLVVVVFNRGIYRVC